MCYTVLFHLTCVMPAREKKKDNFYSNNISKLINNYKLLFILFICYDIYLSAVTWLSPLDWCFNFLTETHSRTEIHEIESLCFRPQC